MGAKFERTIFWMISGGSRPLTRFGSNALFDGAGVGAGAEVEAVAGELGPTPVVVQAQSATARRTVEMRMRAASLLCSPDMLGSYLLSLLGGALIGLSASLFLYTHGRVAGISGLFGGLFLPENDARGLRAWFIGGLCAAGLVVALAYPAAFSMASVPALPFVGIAGLVVGFGTRLGGGCTSGHGVCGMSRFSKRSFVATLTFMAVAIVTVFVMRHVLHTGGAS